MVQHTGKLIVQVMAILTLMSKYKLQRETADRKRTVIKENNRILVT